VTSDQSRNARDAEDALLLETGDHTALLAAYYPVVRQRCMLGVRGDAAEDVAHDVCARLASELCRGKRYRVPYRVVVHQLVSWTIKDHHAGIPTDLPLPYGWDAVGADNPFALFESDYDLDQLLHGLSDGDREVAELRYRSALEIDQIAERLGKQRNAVDQALWRAHRKLRVLIGAH
jgi:DNA-directed RNA polymerase specialized sigma24 family protein